MSKRSFRVALVVVATSVVLLLGVAGYLTTRALSYPEARHPGSGAKLTVEIPPRTSFPKVAALLRDKGVISRPRWFRLYAMWRGDTTNVKARTDPLICAVPSRLPSGTQWTNPATPPLNGQRSQNAFPHHEWLFQPRDWACKSRGWRLFYDL